MRHCALPYLSAMKNDCIKLSLIASILLFHIGLYAQPHCRMQRYSFEEGLPHNIVTGVLQDQNGMIWVSTWNGLSRFDGHEFVNYGPQPGDGCTMRNSRINHLRLSTTGNIWCLNHETKAYLFQVQKRRFIDVLLPMEQHMHQHFEITDIQPLSNGVTWILANGSIGFRVIDSLLLQDEVSYDRAVEVFGTFDGKIKGSIYGVHLDAMGNEWLLTDKGLKVLGKDAFASDYPFQFFLEHQQSIWLATQDGRLAQFDRKTRTLQFVSLPEDVGTVFFMNSVSDRRIALGSNAGLLLLDASGGLLKQIHLVTKPGERDEAQLMYEDRQGGFWLHGADDGVIYVASEANPIRLQSPLVLSPNAEFNRFFAHQDESGRVWVVPKGGQLSYYDPESNSLKTAYERVVDQEVPVTPPLRNVQVDGQGNIWTGSGKGLWKLSLFTGSFEHFTVEPGDVEVRSLHQDAYGRVWTATKSAVIRLYNKERRSLGYLSSDGRIVANRTVFGSNVYRIMEDSKGRIWLGAKMDGLFCLSDLGKGTSYQIQHFQPNSNDVFALKGSSVYALMEDRHGRIWVGTYEGGLNLVEEQSDGSIRFLNNDNRLKNYPKDIVQNVRCLTELHNGVIAAGTLDGLITFDGDFDYPEQIRFYRNIRRPNDAASLSANDVMAVFEDSRKQVYVITQNGGLNRLLSPGLLNEALTFEIFNQQNGLRSNLTRVMTEDSAGKLWLISTTGISRWYEADQRWVHLKMNGYNDRLLYSEATLLHLDNHTIWVGTDKGVFVFNPQTYQQDTYEPPLYFTGIKIQGKDLTQSVQGLSELILEPNQRNLTIQYAALDYKNPDDVQYAYRLSGLDESWHYEGSNRSAVYVNLPHGSYVFELRSTNGDGLWTKQLATLPIQVLPTFWETPWAWLLMVLTSLLLIGLVVYVWMYIYRLRHKVDVEQQLSDVKLRFFTDISHDLRTPLTLISCPVADVLENEEISDSVRKHLNVVQNNVNHLMSLVNQILDFRKIQNKKMKLVVESCDILPIIRKTMQDFGQIAASKSMDFRFECNEAAVLLWIDANKFERILFNLFSNAFKYSSDHKSIVVRVLAHPQEVMLSVRDEGSGIPKHLLDSIFERFEMGNATGMHQQSSGIGLSLVKELMQLHHGRIEVESELEQGSCFHLFFKTGRQHFEQDDFAEMLVADGLGGSYEETYGCEQGEEACAEEELFQVLVVEDNPEMLHFLKDVLSREYKVLAADNGLDGLQLALDHLPDLVLTDVMMPGMDGLELVRRIKENKDICHIPIIVLSAKAALEDRLQGLEAGIDDYITKPFSASYLTTRIRSLLKQRQEWQESLLSSSTLLGSNASKEGPVELQPSEPQVTSYDDRFLKDLMQILEKQLDNTELNIDMLATELSMSRTVFYKKVKSLLGITPIDLIRDIRIKRSIQLLEVGGFSLTEIAYMCGFSDSNYFSKCFKKITGYTPSKYKDTQLSN